MQAGSISKVKCLNGLREISGTVQANLTFIRHFEFTIKPGYSGTQIQYSVANTIDRTVSLRRKIPRLDAF